MPFDPSAPVEELELPPGAPGGFDPSAPVEELDLPQGASGAFDPSQPFEVDASTVGNQREVADGIADAIATALNVSTGISKPLTKLMLRSGGKKTDIAINTLLPMAGGAIGTAVGAPVVGTMAGGAAGGLAGESIVELRQILRGERETFSPGSLIGTTAVSAIVPKPIRAAGSALANAGKTVLVRGAQGAGLGGIQEAVREVIDEGELSLGDIVENALWGSAFGTAFGGLEAAAPAIFKAIRGKPPKEAVKTLREDGTPPALAVANEIDAKLASGEVELPPPTDSGDIAIDRINQGIRDEAPSLPPKPGPEMTRLAETPAGATKLAEIQTALESPDTIIQYSVWPADMIPPGRDRVAQVDLINPKKESLGGLASTNRELLQELGIDAPPAPDSLPPGRYTLDEIKAAIAKETPPAATPEVGLGAASPKEFQPVNKSVTGIRNETVDQQRAERGLPPLMSEAAKDLGTTWDDAMKRIDEDQNIADRLIAELKVKPKALDDVDTAVLLHREIDLRNQFDRVSRNIDENIGTPDSLASDRATQARVLDELNDLETVSRQAGTATGRGLNARKLMAAEDFSLAKMLTKRRAAKGGAKLTPEEEAQVKEQHDAINEAQRALDQHEAQLELDAAVATPEAATQQITKLESEIESAPKGKSGDDFKKAARKRIDDLKKRVESGDFSKKDVVLDEQGRMLQAKAEKAKAEFNDALARDKYEQLSTTRKFLANAADTWDLIRNIYSSGEFSVVLRQGLLPLASRPIATAKAIPKAVKAFLSDEVMARTIDLDTLSSPDAAIAREAGVQLDEPGQKLGQREESIASEWAKKIPGLRNFNQFSRVFLNKVRVDNFKAMKNVRPDLTADDLKLIAKYVNQATGRGSLGKFGNKNAAELNRLLFSARFQASRLQYLTGNSAWGGNGRTRAIIGREYARTLLGLAAMYSLYELGFSDEEGYQPVSFEPRETDFGKLHFGPATIDPLAGLSQWIVFGTRTGLTLADSFGVDTGGQSINSKGELVSLRDPKFGQDSLGDVAVRFGRSKLHPLVGATWNAATGRDIINQPTSWLQEAEKFTMPMTYEDILQAFQTMDVDQATAVSALAMLGMGLNVQQEKEGKQMGVARPEASDKQQPTRPAK